MDVAVQWPLGHLSPQLSEVAVWTVGVFGPLALIVLSVWRRVHNARQADRADGAFDPGAELAVGLAVIGGTLELARGQSLAARVEITQRGDERETDGSVTHRWIETERRTEAKPFYLRRPGGDRIRVEPDTRAQVIDDLDHVEVLGPRERVRSAELVPGEEIIATGSLQRGHDPELAGGYRGDTSLGWVLRPARPQMVLSSKPLGAPLADRARFHRRALWWMSVPLTLVVLVTLNFHVLRWGGDRAVAVVTDKELDEGYFIHTEVEGGSATTRDLVTADVYEQLEVGDHVAVVVRPPLGQLGSAATAHLAMVLVALAILLATAIGYGVAVARARPWWAPGGRRVDRGAGRLEPGAKG